MFIYFSIILNQVPSRKVVIIVEVLSSKAEDFKRLPLPEMKSVFLSRVRDAILRYEEARNPYRNKLRDALFDVYPDLGLLQAEIGAALDIEPKGED